MNWVEADDTPRALVPGVHRFAEAREAVRTESICAGGFHSAAPGMREEAAARARLRALLHISDDEPAGVRAVVAMLLVAVDVWGEVVPACASAVGFAHDQSTQPPREALARFASPGVRGVVSAIEASSNKRPEIGTKSRAARSALPRHLVETALAARAALPTSRCR